MNESVHIENKNLILKNSVFKEITNPKTGKRNYVIEALIVPFNTISRNGVLYSKESIERTYKELIGKPVMYNHVTEGVEAIPRGEWTEVWLEADGMHGRANIWDTSYNKNMIEFLSNASNPTVSLQVVGDAKSKKNDEGKAYQEATINDWLECSVIGGVSGFKNARINSFEVAIAEAMGKGIQENKPEETEEESFDMFAELSSIRDKY